MFNSKKIPGIYLLFRSQIWMIAIVVMLFIGCNQDEEIEETNSYEQVGVPNVNGNIPDTTNSIDLSTQKTDSSIVRDSSNVE